MKIGIDARMLGKGFGLARYVEQLTKHLLEIDHDNQYVLFVRPENFQKIKASGEVKVVLCDIPWYSWQEQIKFKKIIAREEVDLMHFPHWNVPLFYNAPFVVTVHDLIMFHHARPEATTLGPLKFWLKDKIHRLVVKHAVEKSKHIIATSEFTKRDIVDTLNIKPDRISVTYQAPFEARSNLPDRQAGEQGTVSNEIDVLKKFDINKPYVLYVGAAYPHKNLAGLLKAWELFEEKYNGEYQLVLVGKDNYFYRRLQSTVERRPSTIFTGFVDDVELSELYSHAKLYVFPSLYEGFGLPPLEAMMHGVPVVSSNRTCLPEVLGEAALYFDPENIAQMAEVMHTGLTDENIRFELKTKARETLSLYSWQRLAEQTKEIYEI